MAPKEAQDKPDELAAGAGQMSSSEVRDALRLVIWDGVATQGMASLAAGVILVGLAVELEASNLLIGVLASLPFLAQLLQIPGVFIVERVRVRRMISARSDAVGRSMLFIVAFSIFIPDQKLTLTLITIAVAIRLALGAISNCAWSSWMRDLVPERGMGSFYSRRMIFTTVVAAVLTLAAGIFIDQWGNVYPADRSKAYVFLFILGGIIGLIGASLVSRTPEPQMAPAQGHSKLAPMLMEPFRDQNFRRLMVFLGSWEFAINIAAPFFTVYMLRRLDYPMSMVIVLTVLSQVANIAFFRIWGQLSDRYSNKSVLAVCGPLFILCIFGWTFVTFPDVHALTVPLLILLHVLMGISTAGVTLASNNIGLKLAPKGKATAYLAARSVASSLAAGIAPIIGGGFADLFVDKQLSMSFRWESAGNEIIVPALVFVHWDFFFLLAAILGLYSLHRLTLVREEGEVEEEIVVEEFFAETWRSIGNLSSAAGLRAVTIFPFSSIRKQLFRAR